MLSYEKSMIGVLQLAVACRFDILIVATLFVNGSAAALQQRTSSFVCVYVLVVQRR